MSVSISTSLRALVLVWAGCLAGQGAFAMPPTGEADDHWIGVWGTAPYGPYPNGPLKGIVPPPYDSLTSPAAFDGEQARNQSFRMVVRPTRGGGVLRLRFSNLVGTQPVALASARVAIRLAAAAIVPGTDTPVTFSGGSAGIEMAPGQEVISDPVTLPFTHEQDLAISFHVAAESGPMTWHAVSFDLNYLAGPDSGDVTGDSLGAQFHHPTVGWFFLTGVDVDVGDGAGGVLPGAETVVAIGDSITDGAYQVPATNTRWPDLLAARLQERLLPVGVLNKGINSNRVTGSPSANRGNPALMRFDRDVLQRSGVRSVVIFEGTNDITSNTSAEEIYAGLSTLVRRAQKAGLCVVLGTIPPREDVMFGWNRQQHESVRQSLNAMIRANTEVDGIADFDVALGHPQQPDYPDPAYFFPDLLHPNSVGFQVMADAVPLEPLLSPINGGTCRREPVPDEDGG